MLVAVKVEDTGRAVNMLREIQNGFRLTSKTIQMFGGSPLEEIDLSSTSRGGAMVKLSLFRLRCPFSRVRSIHARAVARQRASFVGSSKI